MCVCEEVQKKLVNMLAVDNIGAANLDILNIIISNTICDAPSKLVLHISYATPTLGRGPPESRATSRQCNNIVLHDTHVCVLE